MNNEVGFLAKRMRAHAENFTEVTGIPVSSAAERFLLAIAMQESALKYRFQLGRDNARPGPAKGWWQFERGGGVRGVMKHERTAAAAKAIVRDHGVRHNEHAIHRAIEGNDALAFAFARLLLWSSPNRIPLREKAAWVQYAVELWRPGKPHPEKWARNWRLAGEAVDLLNLTNAEDGKAKGEQTA